MAVKVYTIMMTFLLFGIIMAGLFMVLLSKKLWSQRKYTWRERIEPQVIVGLACMLIPMLLMICAMYTIMR